MYHEECVNTAENLQNGSEKNGPEKIIIKICPIECINVPKMHQKIFIKCVRKNVQKYKKCINAPYKCIK